MTFSKIVPSEIMIRRYLKDITFGKHIKCAVCNSWRIKKYGNRYHCKRCRKFFSLTSANWLKGCKLPLQTLWMILWCWTQKVPIDQTQKFTGVNNRTVRHWFDIFRDNIHEDFNVRLDKNIQVDEMYRGGKKNGYAIVGCKQSQSRKIVCKVLPKSSVDRRDIVKIFS